MSLPINLAYCSLSVGAPISSILQSSENTKRFFASTPVMMSSPAQAQTFLSVLCVSSVPFYQYFIHQNLSRVYKYSLCNTSACWIVRLSGEHLPLWRRSRDQMPAVAIVINDWFEVTIIKSGLRLFISINYWFVVLIDRMIKAVIEPMCSFCYQIFTPY